MLTRPRTLLAAAAGALLAMALVAPAAGAPGDDPVDVHPIGGGGGGVGGGARVDIRVEDPGGSGTEAQPVANRPKGSGSGTCTFLGQAVDCTDSQWGPWYGPDECWIRLMSPQPDPMDPIWEGQEEGAVYWCQPPFMGAGMGGGHMLWLPRQQAELVDPVVLAQRAVDSMRLVGAKVGATPLNGGTGIVGLQTWLWVANDGPTSMGPITRTATAGSVSVRATARVTEVAWDMGDGHVQRCRNAGTVWRSGVRGSKGDSPNCGYTYVHDSGDQPGDAYTVRPTTRWRVDWTGAGQSGVITFTIDGGELAMPVVELQTVRVG